MRKDGRMLFLKGNCLSPVITFISWQRKPNMIAPPNSLITLDASYVMDLVTGILLGPLCPMPINFGCPKTASLR